MVGVDAQLGAFCLVNTSAIVGLDAQIGERAVIAPGAFVGEDCHIGSDPIARPLVKVLEGIRLGDDVCLGLGCLVLRSLVTATTVLASAGESHLIA